MMRQSRHRSCLENVAREVRQCQTSLTAHSQTHMLVAPWPCRFDKHHNQVLLRQPHATILLRLVRYGQYQ